MNNGTSKGDDQIKDLGERIAKLISGQNESSALEKLQTSVDEIRTRIEMLEIAIPKMTETAPLSVHPSQDRFQIAEAGVETLHGTADDNKACPFEPGGKPCDHCSMCSARGF